MKDSAASLRYVEVCGIRYLRIDDVATFVRELDRLVDKGLLIWERGKIDTITLVDPASGEQR